MQYLSGISEANWVIYKNLFLWSINTRGPVHVDGSESELQPADKTPLSKDEEKEMKE